MRTHELPLQPAVQTGDRPAPTGLEAALERAVARGIIDRAQAEAIVAAEVSEAVPLTPAGESRVRVLVAEAIGYVGAALALVSAFLVAQRLWEDLRPWSRVAFLGVVTAALAAGGALLRSPRTGAVARLGSVLWLLASGGFAGFAALAWVELAGLEGESVVALTGASTAVFSGALWSLRRSTLQQAATFASLAVTVVGTLAVVDTSLAADYADLAVWALGMAWLLLAYAGMLAPVTTGYVLGALGALGGPLFGSSSETDWVLLVGLATAGLLVAASIPLRRTVLLGLGTAGLFLLIPRIVFAWFGETLGPAVALFVTGVVLITVALALTRLRRPGRQPPAGG